MCRDIKVLRTKRIYGMDEKARGEGGGGQGGYPPYLGVHNFTENSAFYGVLGKFAGREIYPMHLRTTRENDI